MEGTFASNHLSRAQQVHPTNHPRQSQTYPRRRLRVRERAHAHQGEGHDGRGDLVLVQDCQQAFPPQAHVALDAEEVGGVSVVD